jgi:putative pyruvate formate lyase activating enzyme
MERRAFIHSCAYASLGCAALGVRVAFGGPKRGPKRTPSYLRLERDGVLAEREKELWKLHDQRACCPRRCDEKRKKEEPRVCGKKDKEVKVASAGPHSGEERPLVGSGGSGTIFFSNCSLLCCYCQNWEIAHRGDGDVASTDFLARTMLGLQKLGCHNINLVTPTHVIAPVVTALRLAAANGLRLPLVYNTGGYDRLEAIRLLDGVVDIYMPDFKYQDGDVAHELSLEARDYPTAAAAAIAEMHRQVGVLEVDEDGVAQRGVILRHLVLPNNLAGTDRFVKWVAKELGPDTYVNIMAQYRPEYRAKDDPNLNRRITSREWSQAMAWAEEAGLRNLD